MKLGDYGGSLVQHFYDVGVRGKMMLRPFTNDGGNIRLCVMQFEIC
jgi:hypothetical protein